VLRYPITVSFRLSEADAFRLKRLMDKYGSGFRNHSDNDRFRAMLRGIDHRDWEHLYDSDGEAEAFEENKHMDQLELSQFEKRNGIRFSRFHKLMAEMKVAPNGLSHLRKREERPVDPDDPADDRNWFTEEPGEEEPESED
jgi:hypothetical protein